MRIRNWLLRPGGAVWLSVLLTAVVLIESKWTPWAPYFIVYAVLAIFFPLYLRTRRFGSFAGVFRRHWKFIAGVCLLALFFDQVIFTRLYQQVLDGFGVGGDAFYSLDAALNVMIAAVSAKFQISPDAAQLLYAFFILIWAPVGEELYYRGYLLGVLRRTNGFAVSSPVSAFFFAIRHATHLFFLWPAVPWAAMASWVAGAFVFGLLMNWLYEKTESLYPPMLVHAAVNLVELFFL
jgi:membrane protease YdiL (CAAX protease family)